MCIFFGGAVCFTELDGLLDGECAERAFGLIGVVVAVDSAPCIGAFIKHHYGEEWCILE